MPLPPMTKPGWRSCGEVLSGQGHKCRGKRRGKCREKTSGEIIDAIRQNGHITIAELAQQIGITQRSIERNIQKLQAERKLRRIGAAKGGHWEVVGDK